MKNYIYLFLAIFFEVFGTLMLPKSDNFSNKVVTFLIIFLYILAFYCLTFAIKSIPLSIAYATWCGLGIFIITIFSFVFFEERLNLPIIFGLILIIIGVVIVNYYSYVDN